MRVRRTRILNGTIVFPLASILALASAGCSGESGLEVGTTTTSTSTTTPGSAAGTTSPTTATEPDGSQATSSPPASLSAPLPTGKAGREVPAVPDPTASAGLPDLEPPAAQVPLAPSPWPAAAQATGELVDGFPRALRPVQGSRTVSSSLSPGGDQMQVSLEASTPRAPGSVLRAYRTRLQRHGLVAEPVAAVAGSRALAFRDDQAALTVTVRSDAGRTLYTVHGVLREGED